MWKPGLYTTLVTLVIDLGVIMSVFFPHKRLLTYMYTSNLPYSYKESLIFNVNTSNTEVVYEGYKAS